MNRLIASVIVMLLAGGLVAQAQEKDTGVGENGIALESSPAFEKDGVPVDMFNIVRAETAKYNVHSRHLPYTTTRAEGPVLR
jgi:hypothetical protein